MKRVNIGFLWLMCVCFCTHGQHSLKVMSYNLRFGELASLEQLGTFIKENDPDIVLLQEVDIYTQRPLAPHQNGKNFIAELGYYTHMMSIFSKSISYKGGYYGLGILSKYPFASTKKHLLPMIEPKREQRCLLTAEVELDSNQTVMVACTHLDLKSSIRVEQVKAINDLLTAQNRPVIVGGDFNAQPHSEEIAAGMKAWIELSATDFTSPSKAPKNKIDYIFGYPSSAWTLTKSIVPVVQLSDHLPIISTIELLNK